MLSSNVYLLETIIECFGIISLLLLGTAILLFGLFYLIKTDQKFIVPIGVVGLVFIVCYLATDGLTSLF